jgi:hypothetical protein
MWAKAGEQDIRDAEKAGEGFARPQAFDARTEIFRNQSLRKATAKAWHM